MKRLLCVAVAVVACSFACGGGMAPEKSVTPSSPRNGTSEDAPSSTNGSQPTAVPSHVDPQSPGNFARPPSRERADFERSAQQVDASIGECATACRALASMESAAHHLCDLGDAGECSVAQQRVVVARERVERACGKCR